MSDQEDWILLSKIINSYSENISLLWGNITRDNCINVISKKYKDKTLFEFLVDNSHFSCAHTIAPYINMCSDQIIDYIYEKHNNIYISIVKNLHTLQSFFVNNDILSETISVEFIYDINKRFEKIKLEKKSSDIITSIIYEADFLLCDNIKKIYNNLEKNYQKNFDNFYMLYINYIKFVPLLYKLLNEYYIENVKNYVNSIIDLCSSAIIIISEIYNSLKILLLNLPKKYIDFKYQDVFGNNILMYISMLPIVFENFNNEIYDIILNLNSYFDLYNNDKNNIYHLCVIYDNIILLNKIIKLQPDIKKILSKKNNDNKNVFDILIEKNNYEFLLSIINYMPSKYFNIIKNNLIKNFDIIDKIPDNLVYEDICLCNIGYYMDELFFCVDNILYDKSHYDNTKLKIGKLFSRKYDYSNYNRKCYIEWLNICIIIDDIDMFNQIINKFFYLKNIACKYFDKQMDNNGEPIIVLAIRSKKIPFIKKILEYNVNLCIVGTSGHNGITSALETKNLYILTFIKKFMQKDIKYDKITIIDSYIKFLNGSENNGLIEIYKNIGYLWKYFHFIIQRFYYGI